MGPVRDLDAWTDLARRELVDVVTCARVLAELMADTPALVGGTL